MSVVYIAALLRSAVAIRDSEDFPAVALYAANRATSVARTHRQEMGNQGNLDCSHCPDNKSRPPDCVMLASPTHHRRPRTTPCRRDPFSQAELPHMMPTMVACLIYWGWLLPACSEAKPPLQHHIVFDMSALHRMTLKQQILL